MRCAASPAANLKLLVLDMNNAQSSELELILNAAASRPRPALKYSRMSAEKLVIIWHYLICVKSFSFALVAEGARRTRVHIPAAEWDEFETEPLTRPLILKLAEWCYIPRLFWVIAECMYEEPYTIKEIDNRL